MLLFIKDGGIYITVITGKSKTENSIKYKKLTSQQIIISIDRLTRFKPTEEKYLRVFRDIILSNLIEPKFKKSDLENMEYSQIRDYAVEIFNGSLDEGTADYSINEKLKEYENATFVNNDGVQVLLDNKLNYAASLKYIGGDTDVKNLIWLKNLGKSDIKKLREKEKFLFPLEKVVIAEGITEEILLPVFAQICGYDFDSNGVKVIAAGGKNQVVKLYYKLCEELKLPIFILLDKDAESNGYSINTKLRKQDEVYLLESGEFEDLLPEKLIIKTVNSEFKNFVSIGPDDLDTGMSTVKTLEELFKDKCLHEFKKAEFAQKVKQQIKSVNDASSELVNIIDEIKNLKTLNIL